MDGKTLSHNSMAVHRTHARNAKLAVPPLKECEPGR
jgi:hypothetical protein